MEHIEYKGVYRVIYFPNERADRIHIDDVSRKPDIFEGTIQNFYPSGKCVFYNEISEQILAIQYECIYNIYPIKEYKVKKDENMVVKKI